MSSIKDAVTLAVQIVLVLKRDSPPAAPLSRMTVWPAVTLLKHDPGSSTLAGTCMAANVTMKLLIQKASKKTSGYKQKIMTKRQGTTVAASEIACGTRITV